MIANDNDFDKNMSSILDIPHTSTEIVPVKESLPVIPRNAEDDFSYSRATYYNLIEKGNEALDGILRVASESQHPRAYEVASNMLKNLGDVTDKLMILQRQKKDLDGSQDKPTQVTVDKAVFVGSTADLLKKVRRGDD
jgi:hypothetical protein